MPRGQASAARWTAQDPHNFRHAKPLLMQPSPGTKGDDDATAAPQRHDHFYLRYGHCNNIEWLSENIHNSVMRRLSLRCEQLRSLSCREFHMDLS